MDLMSLNALYFHSAVGAHGIFFLAGFSEESGSADHSGVVEIILEIRNEEIAAGVRRFFFKSRTKCLIRSNAAAENYRTGIIFRDSLIVVAYAFPVAYITANRTKCFCGEDVNRSGLEACGDIGFAAG